MIYFIRRGDDGAIKIGFTDRDPRRRMKDLQVGSDIALRLVAVADGDLEEEGFLHERFADCRLSGEWFTATERLLAHIQEHALPFVGDQEIGRNTQRVQRFRSYIAEALEKRINSRADMLQISDLTGTSEQGVRNWLAKKNSIGSEELSMLIEHFGISFFDETIGRDVPEASSAAFERRHKETLAKLNHAIAQCVERAADDPLAATAIPLLGEIRKRMSA